MAHATSKEADALLDREFKVLDHGFIRLVDYMGSDQAIVQAARVSYGEGTKKISEDRALIRYLMRQRHTSPFEMVELKFHVKLPIFVARQWIRHRSASVNEYSGRYSVMRPEFFRPERKDIRLQSTVNKQGRSQDELPDDIKDRFLDHLQGSQETQYAEYEAFVETGLARELARINLPLSLYTEWYWKIDLHNLFHFLRLRMDSHAQAEMRAYANIMAEVVRTVCPIAYEAFEDYTVNAATFSAPELVILVKYLESAEMGLDSLVREGLSKREAQELLAKLERIRRPNGAKPSQIR
ncbi:MAG TPA: FAD-dependent thymidylate synthase [Acidobacteriota bacterium]|nr:FAD-dependent thymidylate synthase [Acidobacteriota bacterium]